MKITNTNNLPAPLVAAVSQQRTPTPDSISVTTLISPPQIRLLTLQHWAELEEDASDRIWATMGSLMHLLLAQHAPSEGHQAERTLETEIEGVKVTGTFDLFVEDGTVIDYKFVSVWTTKDGIKPEWAQQLNCYAELLRRAGETVTALKIVAIYRDWSKNKAHDHSYPQAQVQTFDVALWSQSHAQEFLSYRVRLHLDAQEAGIGNSLAYDCSDEERWARPTKYAVMKRGNKKAIKLHDIQADAALHAAGSSDYYVEERPGAQVRCESYCAVARFCPQYAKLREQSEG
jgi:hypothetical protein